MEMGPYDGLYIKIDPLRGEVLKGPDGVIKKKIILYI